jgi:membrane associated rhomboid family serine protease
LPEAHDEPWVEVGRYRDPADADAAGLALVSAGIGSHLTAGAQGVTVHVHAADAVRASRELIAFDAENHPPPHLAEPLPPLLAGADAAFAYATVLIVLFVASGRGLFGLDWEDAGAAAAGLMRGGEWWRAVTALTLHANLGHLASNVFAGALLGLFVAQRLGSGLAWLAILLAGALGNALNALAVPASHVSIGASTSVFSALGLLAALQWRSGASAWRRGLRAFLPLAAGIMLLALLGFGEDNVDYGAHVAGFGVGVAAGAALHVTLRRIPRGRGAQRLYALAAAALLALSWLAALTVTGAAR